MTEQRDAVTVRFTATRADVFGAVAGYLLRKTWYLLLLPIVGAAAIVWRVVEPNEYAVSFTNGAVLLVVGVYIFIGIPYLRMRTVTKSPNFGKPVTVGISEQGMELTGAQSSARVGWPIVKGVSQTRRAVLIHIRPAGFQIVPKGQLSPEDLTALRTVLALYTPRK